MGIFKDTIVLNSITKSSISIEDRNISIKDSSISIDLENAMEIGLGEDEVLIFAEIEKFKNIKEMELSKTGFFIGPNYSKLKLSDEKKKLIIFMDKKSCLSLIYKNDDKNVGKALETENPSEEFEKIKDLSDRTKDLITLVIGSTEEELKEIVKNNKEYIISISVI